MIHKTNAARILDQKRIPYELIPYAVEETKLGAEHVAASLGEPIAQVFKTILLRGERKGLLVAVVPGDREVNLKAIASLAGDKKVEPVAVKELLPLTGYIRGGCSPIGMKKPYPVYLHESAMPFDFIYISAGQRGLQLKIAPQNLVKATFATVAAIV
ncbi:MAG TPA: Cys-tRNA(Pro) deacylase [Fibrobacteraceae bacterium]|nr:Cys-tRNA(Pro) deacylase [Fibrobacteraceae bacterium]